MEGSALCALDAWGTMCVHAHIPTQQLEQYFATEDLNAHDAESTEHGKTKESNDQSIRRPYFDSVCVPSR